MKGLIQFVQILNNLRNVPRTGMTLFAGLNPDDVESIAEHSFKTVYISMILGDLAIAEGHRVDMEFLLRYSIIHDWSEEIIGDIPTSSPSYGSFFKNDIRSIFKEAERKALKELSNIATSKTKKDYSTLSMQRKPVEKALLKMADTMSILIEILELRTKGYNIKWFEYLWANTIRRLEQEGVSFEFTKELINAFETTFKEPKSQNPLLTKPEYQEKRD